MQVENNDKLSLTLGQRLLVLQRLESASKLSRVVRDLSLICSTRLTLVNEIEVYKKWSKAVKLLTEAHDIISELE